MGVDLLQPQLQLWPEKNDLLTKFCATRERVDAALQANFVLSNGDMISGENVLDRKELAGVTPCTHELCIMTKHMSALFFYSYCLVKIEEVQCMMPDAGCITSLVSGLVSREMRKD